ncbi:hypothetical protein [Flagellimonas sp.]|uniref:hypothetical protein n=1 Tax=Flagellimonas sp. TaxID=2058762 RepID=UPI003F4A4ACF
MKTRAVKSVDIPRWWFILPAYLTLWTLLFSIYSYFDGNGMMKAFGIDTGGASDFIMLNSAGRYLALALVMVFGIWVFRTVHSILLALIGRLTMDILDLVVGLQTHVITDSNGIIQSFLMFLLPNLISIYLLIRFYRR